MADISNKSLALILLVAVVVSMTGTLYTLDRMEGSGVVGYAVMNQSGKSNFSINSSLSIRFVDMTTVQFGAGYVNDSIASQECVINSTMTSAQVTAAASGCIGFNNTISSRNLTIENDGNILANVTLNFTANATNFIGGTNPSFQFYVKNNETGACAAILNGTNWQDINMSYTNGMRACNLMNYSDTNDTFQIALSLHIPKTASPGAHTVNIYAIACDDNSC